MDEYGNSKVNSFLTFKIGDEIFAASVENVLNILEMTKITKVPKAPSYMKGVINLRGSVLPVLDTRLKFGLEEGEITTNTCILVMELLTQKEEIKLGAIVDSVQEVLEISQSDIQAPPSIGTKFRNDFITGMVKKDDKFIMIIDIVKVFSGDEILNMQDISLGVQNITVSKD